MTQQLLLTEAEAADRLRLSIRTLRKARNEGRLHYVLIGRAIRYTIADLESYIETLRQVQPPFSPNDPTRNVTSTGKRRSGEVISFTERNRAR
ncbi:helix-turn-helix domain-containing protein [Novosphingobium sp. 9]|uniref:helix-turn-helix domain-containing protein n=1 Tax=Novosphingobium sp. 9 TaxID=2025349 RepID=UPI0021B5AC4D|nr:helix-turn-helix domain-containing protein [Novosphingobium sp. 9]